MNEDRRYLRRLSSQVGFYVGVAGVVVCFLLFLVNEIFVFAGVFFAFLILIGGIGYTLYRYYKFFTNSFRFSQCIITGINLSMYAGLLVSAFCFIVFEVFAPDLMERAIETFKAEMGLFLSPEAIGQLNPVSAYEGAISVLFQFIFNGGIVSLLFTIIFMIRVQQKRITPSRVQEKEESAPNLDIFR